MTKLIALLALNAVALLDGTTKDIAQGETFEVPQDTADQMLATNVANLADTAPPAPTPSVKRKPVKVRLLIDSPLGKANDVVTLSASDAKAAEAAGQADSDDDAVAYALTLPQNQPQA